MKNGQLGSNTSKQPERDVATIRVGWERWRVPFVRWEFRRQRKHHTGLQHSNQCCCTDAMGVGLLRYDEAASANTKTDPKQPTSLPRSPASNAGLPERQYTCQTLAVGPAVAPVSSP